MRTILNIKNRRRVNGRFVTVCATISVDTTDASPAVAVDGDGVIEEHSPIESLPFEDRIACLADLEDALINSIERYL